jgi:hypothetical protein
MNAEAAASASPSYKFMPNPPEQLHPAIFFMEPDQIRRRRMDCISLGALFQGTFHEANPFFGSPDTYKPNRSAQNGMHEGERVIQIVCSTSKKIKPALWFFG